MERFAKVGQDDALLMVATGVITVDPVVMIRMITAGWAERTVVGRSTMKNPTNRQKSMTQLDIKLEAVRVSCTQLSKKLPVNAVRVTPGARAEDVTTERGLIGKPTEVLRKV